MSNIAIIVIFWQDNNFLLLIIDDFHCVRAIKDPKDAKLSECIDMCTGVVDSQKSLPAIKETRLVHQDVPVKVPGGGVINCRGGINPSRVNDLFRGYLPKYFKHSYLDVLPREYHEFDMTHVNRSFVELR